MWLSAFILLPLGIILTYMAATESTIMNGESYKNAIKKIFTTFTRPFRKKTT
jgi:lipopolysaccharide export system permease protein